MSVCRRKSPRPTSWHQNLVEHRKEEFVLTDSTHHFLYSAICLNDKPRRQTYTSFWLFIVFPPSGNQQTKREKNSSNGEMCLKFFPPIETEGGKMTHKYYLSLLPSGGKCCCSLTVANSMWLLWVQLELKGTIGKMGRNVVTCIWA